MCDAGGRVARAAKSECGVYGMDAFWGCISNLSSVTTIITAFVDAARDAVSNEELYKLKTLDIGIDFSTLSAELEQHMEIVNQYATQKRDCIIGSQLFSSVEKEQFVTDLLAQKPALRQYRCEVESVLYKFLGNLEQLLISQMSPGEQVLVHKVDTSQEILRRKRTIRDHTVDRARRLRC